MDTPKQRLRSPRLSNANLYKKEKENECKKVTGHNIRQKIRKM